MLDIKFEWKAVTEISEQLKIMNGTLKQIADVLTPQEAVRIKFYALIEGKMRMVVQMFLKVNQNLPMTIAISDKFGNPAKVDGAPVWALTDTALGALQVSEDGMSATLVPQGAVGTLKVQVKCDADLGEGVKEILGELDIELLAGEAEVVAISAGTPV